MERMTREEKEQTGKYVLQMARLLEDGCYSQEMLLKAVRIIDEALEQDWIPCSERMPEEREWIGTKKFGTTISDEVYVTLETTGGKRFCDHIRFQNEKFSISKQAELDAISKGTKPIAWKPLPKPYQPKDGETE